MSQPGTLPAPAPLPNTGQQAVERTAETLQKSGAVGSDEASPAASSTGPVDSGIDSKPCSYLSLFRYADNLDKCCIFVGAIGALCSGAALPVFAYLFGQIINGIGGLTGADLVSNVDSTVLYFVYLAIATFVSSYLEMALWMLSGFRQTARIRQRYLTSALQQEISFFDKHATTGDLLQGLNELSNTVQNGIGEKAGNTLHQLGTFVAGFAIAFTQGWDMTLVLLAVTPLLAVVGAAVASVMGGMSTKANTAYAHANGIVQESLSNIRTVVAFNGQEQTVRRYTNGLTMPVTVGIKSGFLNGVTVGSTNFAFMGAYALALWYGGLRIRDGAYNGGRVLSVLLSALLGGFALGQAAPNFQYFSRACAAGGKCFALIERQPQLQSPATYVPPEADPSASPTLELRGVDFAYPTRPDVMVACNLNIVVPEGHTVALVGESGSGKSTAVSLTQRFYDPTRGQVLLGGQNVRDVPIGWLRSQLALVSQEPALFACTIRENIMYGNPAANQEAVEQAARDANAHNFISELPKGYDTLVGEKGAAISGGQKQRIAIARAIVRNPRLLLLDEATAALDARSERIVQAALERLMQGRTTLLVAHRLSTVIGASNIFVMSKGKVTESGRHADLMSRTDGAYATLMRLQQALPESDIDHMQNPQLDTDTTLDVGRRDPNIQPALWHHADENIGNGAGSPAPAALQPHTTSDTEAAAAAAHESATGNGTKMEVDDENGTVVGSDVTDIHHVVAQRDDSAEAMPIKAKSFFCGGKSKDTSPGKQTGSNPKKKRTSKNGKKSQGKADKHQNGLEAGDRDDSKADDEPPAKASFGRLMGYNRKEWRSAIGGCIASAGLGAVVPVFALAMATIVSVFFTTDFSYMKSTIALWSGIYAIIGFYSFCLSILQQGLFTLMGQKLTRRMRKLMFAAALNQEMGWFDREENQSGALASRLAVDTSRIRGAVGDQLGLLFQNLVTLIAAYIIAFIASWKMTLVITATVPIIALAGYFQAKFMLGSSKKSEKVFDQANQMAAEAFVNIRIIAAFMLETRISDLYQKLLSGPTRDSRKQALASGAGYAVGQGVIFLVYSLAFWYGGQLVARRDITFEGMLKVFFAITLAAVGFSQAQIAFPDITKASSAIGKVFTTIDRIPKIRDAPDAKELKVVDGHVSLRDVTFSYPQRRAVLVLRGFNLEAPAGRTLALVGPSGNGKSTIVSLIERFYDPLSGQVLVDGTDIKSLPLHWWRSNIGLVSQEPVLFGGTIYENITFGQQEAAPERVAAACEVANAMSFIQSAPDGLDTKVGEGGGIQLSGGQKQRIAIARAVLRDPKILLLDEATSALDAVSEQVVQQALNRVSQGRTTITIAHRLSTIWDSDSIAVVQSGCVLEQGSHQELAQIPGGAYASLLMSQQAGFALAK